MKRTLTEVKIDDTHTRWRVVLEDDPSEDGSEYSKVRQLLFLRTLGEHPELLMLGPHRFETLSIVHGAFCWVATAQATVEA